MKKTLEFGDVLHNGARVLRYTPGFDSWAGHVFAIWDGQFVSWHTPRDMDGNLGRAEYGRYFGQDFDRGWQVYCARAGITTEVSV